MQPSHAAQYAEPAARKAQAAASPQHKMGWAAVALQQRREEG